MRDKVKRFLSILMTALMLVNLLPVGALAEGVMISNSVQSIAQKPDGYPVFVFVEVQGNTDGLTMNSDKWFTLGMVKSMNDVTKPPKPVTGYQNNINGVTADDVTAAMTRYKPNESINLGGIRWKGFKSENGASDTYPAYKNQACWHLDGSIRIEDLQVDYTIRYVDENNKEIASSKKKTDKAGSWTKLEKEDIKDITGYTYTDRHDPMQKLVGGKDTVINVYYTTNSYEYKVEHYYDGEIDPSRTDTIRALYGSTVEEYNLELKPKGGYEHETTVNCPLTITEDESKNVIKVYYKKQTNLSYKVNYLEQGTTNVLHEQKVQGEMTFDDVVKSEDEVIEINGYNYASADKETLTIGTGENVINLYYTKRNDLSYTVNYLEKDTLNVLHNPKIQDGMMFDEVVNSADEVIEINGYNYDSVVPEETLTIGTGENVINIYYTKRNDLSYKVNYLEKDTNKVLHNPKVQDGMTFDEVVNSADEVIEINGYNYDSVVPEETLTIGTGENVINIYYTKRNDLSYTVNYLEKVTNKVLHDQKVQGGMTYEDTITSANEKIDISGYNYDSVDPETLTIGTGENVINVYYTKRNDLSYTVNYLEKDTNSVLHEAKTVDKQTFGDTVTETAIDVQGYNKVDPTSQNLTVTADPAENVITFYYTKRTDLSYTVNYYWNGTTEKVADSKTEENQTFEDVIIEAPKLIDGYTPISLERQELTITTDDNDNTITFYYYKNVKLTANSDTLPYNGKEQSVSGYTCAVEEKQKDGSVEYVPWTGEKPLTFEGVSASGLGKDVNEKGYPVTFNDTPIGVNDGLYYVNESQTGTLTITPRPVTLTSETAGKTYDGTALEKPVVTVGGDGFVEGQVKEIKATGSVTNAGSVANTITFTPNKETFKEGNYAITKTEGTLTIAKRSVLITSQSATKTYDGSALTRPAVTITGDGFVPGELAKAEAIGSITKVGSTPNAIRYTTTGAFNAANYSIALSVGTLTVTEKPKPEPRRTFNLTINYVYQNGKRAAASYNRGGLKNGETFDITSPVIAGYTASETVVSGTIYNRDIKVTVIYTADGVNLDDYGVPLGLGNITMNVGDCFE